MRTAIVGAVLLVLGGIAVATGLLPVPEAVELWDRVWPILLFVVAITVVTELAAEAGVFTVLAQQTARWGRGRAWVLWLLVVVVAALSTIFLSLDTTAVLLTPVVIVMARHAGLNPLPFALTTVWMANAGSLLLPVSNLTNLLAQHAMGDPTPAAFAALMLAPALVAMIVPMVVVFVIARKSLLVRYETGEEDGIEDPVLFWISGAVVVALVPLLVSGLPVWLPTSIAAVVLGVVFLFRRRQVLRFGLVPWQLVLLASGLFLFIEALHAAGLATLMATVSGTGESPLALLRLSLTGLVGANAIDNLPAYLALEPVADTPARLAALLIGVNAGPLITPWASLATLLWHQRLTSFDVEIRWSRYMLLGLIVAPVTVVLATLALSLTV
ncbi:Na+/H+ antiporter NhaD [Leifsonia sp. 98AMF]|uniref:SLC13 family permease n=1 Tax=unclassified Leifsonia TaxID=2663824 RepID=UPI00087939D7|nr:MULTISPECIES: SLC13 family permease [unclassified Leifsonia]SDH28679.1 Na+/H+ antiporter NhaD [Leifsonia sp. 197AMF]SDJ09439.1 Na+/H+ antiporter NhaD [Leifsonia sp. 466MF]SDJ61234.1 Na+/H+ antiporter NhaD [Leifsonia sp. 157MF]SDN30624.1 Na+/H+ antiporter NhaD [Leifsonia sp. 509MF]SEM90591.1 Na+/H+ antiporter NhaD [Leifsonia sp. 467MF]